MAKAQETDLLHVLVLTTDQLALLNEALTAQREAAHDDAHHVGEQDGDYAELHETAEAYGDLAAQLCNGWDVPVDEKAALFCALDQLGVEL